MRQLSLFEEEKAQSKKVYASPCGGCICNKCANDVNGRYKPDEMVEACFNCDDCRQYDGDFRKKNNYRTRCEKFAITNYAVQRHRHAFHIVH